VRVLHLRLIVPPGRLSAVEALLRGDIAVTHVVVLPGAAIRPAGDVVECDVVREGASALLDRLKGLGLESDGAIVVDNVDMALSASADRAARRTPGLGVDAVVWEEVEHRTGEETVLSVTFLIFLSVATAIAAIGVLLDQPILIVGAMVVGPEFGPLAALCVGIVQRQWRLARRSLVALFVGFPAAMALTVLFTWVMTGAGLLDEGMLTRTRPLTDFIWRPDALSWVVAFLAGIAGMLSLTSAKSGALIGVLISVTTVPAAANAAVALAYGNGREAGGSALQLVVNLAAIVTAGLLTLTVQRWYGRRRARGRARPEITARG
jgi:uncharacterized hydrophobic protein (TIGR00271 family)